jgi:hypothetical protein
VYHDNESETLVQLVFRKRMNGITLDDLAGSMCVRQKKGEREKAKKELEDKGRRREGERDGKKVNIEQTLHRRLTHFFL